MQAKKHKESTWRSFLFMFYWLGLMAVLLLLVAATYTWFSLSKTPRVNDMDLHVSTPVGLEIALQYDSPDDQWGQVLDFNDLVTQTSVLKPCTWSEKDQCFYAASYGMDGRVAGITMRLTDTENANVEGSRGFYTKGTIYARTGAKVKVSLSEAVTLDDGTKGSGTYVIGTPVWNDQSILHDNGGSGAEYAVRIGIKVTPIGPEGAETGESIFYIYEPNSDKHINGSTEYVETQSIDGTGGLVPAERLITQTTSSWSEAYPVQRDVTIRQMGEFTSEKNLFVLDEGEMVRLDLYIWLEGQDVDCTGQIGDAAQILANLQFAADYDEQSGLVPIG